MAVTHIHELGERHKEGLVPSGWGPQLERLCGLSPCPQWVQDSVSRVDSVKRDPEGKEDADSEDASRPGSPLQYSSQVGHDGS